MKAERESWVPKIPAGNKPSTRERGKDLKSCKRRLPLRIRLDTKKKQMAKGKSPSPGPPKTKLGGEKGGQVCLPESAMAERERAVKIEKKVRLAERWPQSPGRGDDSEIGPLERKKQAGGGPRVRPVKGSSPRRNKPMRTPPEPWGNHDC